MRRRSCPLTALTVACLCLPGVALAQTANSVTTTASFTPDRLGASTNLSTKTMFTYQLGASLPVSSFRAYGPAGMRLDLRGTGSCGKAALENRGPGACPADSRIGFGGGTGLVEVAGEVIKEPFTFELFLTTSEDGRFVILVYVDAIKPVSLQTVLLARQATGQKPYGLGATVEVPPIDTVPGAALASVANIYLTVGAQKIAYYRLAHGHRRLQHVKGLTVPESCPAKGFPLLITTGFADGTSLTDNPTIPCP